MVSTRRWCRVFSALIDSRVDSVPGSLTPFFQVPCASRLVEQGHKGIPARDSTTRSLRWKSNSPTVGRHIKHHDTTSCSSSSLNANVGLVQSLIGQLPALCFTAQSFTCSKVTHKHFAGERQIERCSQLPAFMYFWP